MKNNKFLVFLSLLFLTACGTFQVTIEPISTSTATSIPTITPSIPTNTATAIGSPTEQINPTATMVIPSPTFALPVPTQVPPVLQSATPRQQTVKIFLIALEDNGQSGTVVGCGDSAVPVTVTIPQTQGVLRAALEKLFSAKQQFYGESGFYNALYQSDLQVEGVNIVQGTATIRLTGNVVLGGACDAPRVEAQIEQTALQFSTVSEAEIFIDDVPLEDVLSSK
ncbi:MAG: GerMN domain-containing protein [Chloroflexota bacterium]